jgi:capsular polysaccharide transport system permease protein
VNTSLAEARIPYVSVRRSEGGGLRLPYLRHASGRFSLGKIAAALGLVFVVLPVLLAGIYYIFLASPIFVSESRFAVRSVQETSDIGVDGELSGKEGGALGGLGGAAGGLGGLGGVANRALGGSSTSLQDPFVVSSYLMSPEITRKLDQDGWLRRQFSHPSIDRWSRLAEDASQEELFAYWRRHVTAAVDRRANTIQLRVRAYSAEAARDIAARAMLPTEEMIAELTRRQRDDTLALARTQLAEAEARYEESGLKLRQLRRTTRIVDPAQEVQAAGATLLKLMRERIMARAELETLERLAGPKALGRAELLSRISGLDTQIAEADKRLAGDVSSASVLGAVAATEELELERRFAQGMLNVATNVYDQARREAEHRSSFLLVYLDPTLPTEAREPNIAISVAFVAALAGIAWLFSLTAIAIALDQID